jgi:uncharacterized membrane protein
MDEPKTKPRSLLRRLRAYFIAGLLVTAPIGLTLWLVWVTIRFIDNTVASVLPPRYAPPVWFDAPIPGYGLIVVLVGLTLIGALTRNVIGRYLVQMGEAIVNRTPIIRSLYSALKQTFEAVLGNQTKAFRKVVMVEYPRHGVWSLGFVAGVTEGEVQSLTDEQVLNVYIPTTPNPTSGYLLFVPQTQVIPLTMSVEDGMKMVISGGLVAPPEKPARKPTETEP